jgi:ubiquinol-cytochrome c reductase cytochrome c subunit
MTFRILVLAAAAASVASAAAALDPAQTAPTAQTTTAANAKRVEAGAALYKKKGCYECHVQEAQGGPQGPRLGPNPIPLPRFTAYVRNPTGEMPPFTERVLTTRELEDIYAFLQSRQQPTPVASLPQLAP